MGDPVDPQLVDPRLLVGARDIMALLRLPRPQAVHWYYRHDPSFPRPVATLGEIAEVDRPTLVWYLPEVEEWARANGKWPED